MAFQDITGMRFGHLTVIKESNPILNSEGFKERTWLCQCDCGKTRVVRRSCLKFGTNSSCGCKTAGTKISVGDKFGKLTVLEQVENVRDVSGHMRRAFKCLCECGNTVIVTGKDLSRNRISCGCSRGKNGGESTIRWKNLFEFEKRLYSIWRGMLHRCNEIKSDSYKYYGGRGIKVCDKWIGNEGFHNFEIWAINNGYDDTLSIDRINPNKGYSPDNCRWANSKTQMRNRTNNVPVDFHGEKKLVSEISEEYGIKYGLIYSRIKKGMSAEDAIFDIIKKQNLKSKSAKNL